MNQTKIPKLPEKLKIGYANWGECDEKIFESVQNGLNVIIWFSIDMSSNSEKTKPKFTRGPNYVEVAKMVKRFKDNNYSVINLISIGGWNSPHVNVQFTAEEYFQEWKEFNKRISNDQYDFYGFDGIDWDIEGNTDKNSSINYFTYKELDIMGKFSQLLKKEGYIVSMAPAESYLDPTTDEFSLSLLHNYLEWEKEVPEFNYHGRNVYAYLLAKYSIDTFDFISVQLYEGYTHTLYKYQKEKKDFGVILYDLINSYNEGYIVDFSKDEKSGLGKEIIKIPKEKIVIGLANGWAEERFLFVDEKNIVDAWNFLKEKK
jgi:chitinase